MSIGRPPPHSRRRFEADVVGRHRSGERSRPVKGGGSVRRTPVPDLKCSSWQFDDIVRIASRAPLPGRIWLSATVVTWRLWVLSERASTFTCAQ